MNRPTAMWYAIGALVIIGGVVWSVVGAVRDVSGVTNTFVRFVVPGSTDLRIKQPGAYTLYYEYRSVLDGEIFATGYNTDIKCTLISNASRAPISIEPALFRAEYEFGGRAGKSIAQFTAPTADTYVLNCAYPVGTGERIVLAVAPPFAGGLMGSLLKWLAIALLSFAAGMAILIVTLVRRAGPVAVRS